jgi:hypothetical protein
MSACLRSLRRERIPPLLVEVVERISSGQGGGEKGGAEGAPRGRGGIGTRGPPWAGGRPGRAAPNVSGSG